MSSFNSRLRWCSGAFIMTVVAIFMLQPLTFGQRNEQEASKYAMKWDSVSSDFDMRVLRTHVPGGWFVSVGDGRDTDRPRSTFYYYDPEHVWDGTSQPR